jgi:hypothetical protein
MMRAMAEWLKTRLEMPQVRGLDHDSPELIRIHYDLIKRKPFLRSLYSEHYREFARALEDVPTGPIIEIGSGGGFVKEVIPEAITTDLHPGPHIDRIMSAEQMDFADASVAAVLMLNVFHQSTRPSCLPSRGSPCPEAGRTGDPDRTSPYSSLEAPLSAFLERTIR